MYIATPRDGLELIADHYHEIMEIESTAVFIYLQNKGVPFCASYPARKGCDGKGQAIVQSSHSLWATWNCITIIEHGYYMYSVQIHSVRSTRT